MQVIGIVIAVAAGFGLGLVCWGGIVAAIALKKIRQLKQERDHWERLYFMNETPSPIASPSPSVSPSGECHDGMLWIDADIADRPIAALQLPPRTVRLLGAKGIRTIRQLVEVGRVNVGEMRGVGGVTMRRLDRTLSELGVIWE